MASRAVIREFLKGKVYQGKLNVPTKPIANLVHPSKLHDQVDDPRLGRILWRAVSEAPEPLSVHKAFMRDYFYSNANVPKSLRLGANEVCHVRKKLVDQEIGR